MNSGTQTNQWKIILSDQMRRLQYLRKHLGIYHELDELSSDDEGIPPATSQSKSFQNEEGFID